MAAIARYSGGGGGGGGGGDLLAANNLSDVNNATTSRTNLDLTPDLVDVTQALHGFFLGDVLYWTGTGWAWSNATASASARVDGFVWQIQDANNFTICRTPGAVISGLTDDAFAGLVNGTVYYVSPIIAGMVTATKPVLAAPVCVGIAGGEAIFLPQAISGMQQAIHLSPSAPTTNNDDVDTAFIGRPFAQGDRWLNTTTNTVYECKSAATGMAVWQSTRYTGANGLPIEMTGTATTNDATVTTLISAAIADQTCVLATARVSARQTNGVERATYIRTVQVYREGGGAVLGAAGVQTDFTDESDAAWDCTFDVNGNDLRLRVTGDAGNDVDWAGVLELVEA